MSCPASRRGGQDVGKTGRQLNHSPCKGRARSRVGGGRLPKLNNHVGAQSGPVMNDGGGWGPRIEGAESKGKGQTKVFFPNGKPEHCDRPNRSSDGLLAGKGKKK